MKISYKQNEKQEMRHRILLETIEDLTINRQNACCVKRNYPRKVYDYFFSLIESPEKDQVEKMSKKYIMDWERLHDSFLEKKRPEDLVICYLSGPEPQNDFNELINMGVLPQNIWAFENDNTIYNFALQQLEQMVFPKPKVLKMQIEQFLKNTPKKFDIIYIDACGSIPSDKHALRCLASIFKYHRLSSPGAVITNFAEPDFNHTNIKEQYLELLTLYFWCKDYPNEKVICEGEKLNSFHYTKLRNDVANNLRDYYGEFVRRITMDIASILIPMLRICNSPAYLNMLGKPKDKYRMINLDYINRIKNNSLWKFFSIATFIDENWTSKEYEKIFLLVKECMGLDGYSCDVNKCFDMLMQIKEDDDILNDVCKNVKKYFNTESKIFQFLDKPSSNLFFDTIINQLSYPMHYVTDCINSFCYKAKDTNMFLDEIIFDECRYIYEWLPTMDQIVNAFDDLSWQYVFRFALDGLVKCRIKYNNEFYFSSSVISDNTEGFKECVLKTRSIHK